VSTNIVVQAKRLVALLREFDSLEYSPEDRANTALLIGARLLSIESELKAIGKYVDPTWRYEGGLVWNLKAQLDVKADIDAKAKRLDCDP
jgi:hypothetical protein